MGYPLVAVGVDWGCGVAWRIGWPAAVIAVAVLLAGCSGPVRSMTWLTGPDRPPPTATAAAAAAVTVPALPAPVGAPWPGSRGGDPNVAGPVVVTADPVFGAAGLSPTAPVRITVAHGRITALQVSTPRGVALTGAMSPDGTSWTSAEPLGYGTTYTVTGTATGADGEAVPITGTYTTVTPAGVVATGISPAPGSTVGVAAPVIVTFDHAPADRAVIERHVHITTTPQVQGGWAWIQHDGKDHPSLDWRPKDYWPTGTRVHVESDLYGLDLGGGEFGGDNATSEFTIGRNQVVLADATSHQIVVQRDGRTVASYPASYGDGDPTGDPNRVTRSGIHIVLDKQETTLLSNPAGGYPNVPEHWLVRISGNGGFIHQNQDTVADQGTTAICHGWITLSGDNARAYYDSAIYGDPVQVTGTSIAVSAADGEHRRLGHPLATMANPARRRRAMTTAAEPRARPVTVHRCR